MTNSEKQSKNAIKANIKAKIKEEKRLLFNTTLKVQQPKRTVFTITTIGLAKRESGKYKSRWHD